MNVWYIEQDMNSLHMTAPHGMLEWTLPIDGIGIASMVDQEANYICWNT